MKDNNIRVFTPQASAKKEFLFTSKSCQLPKQIIFKPGQCKLPETPVRKTPQLHKKGLVLPTLPDRNETPLAKHDAIKTTSYRTSIQSSMTPNFQVRKSNFQTSAQPSIEEMSPLPTHLTVQKKTIFTSLVHNPR